MLAIFQGLGPTEIILILVVILLLFGAKKLPELARSLGKSSKEFKKGLEDTIEPHEADSAEKPEATTETKD
ncbi:MAG: twin-arginine translocase TatA/TatE family subunit [Actinomycetota bacterium]